MQPGDNDLLLVTGATGLVGSHLAERATADGLRVRALARESADTKLLEDFGVEVVAGDLTDRESLDRATDGVTWIVHCAAKVGDWGPVDSYRAVNVDGTEQLLQSALASGSLRRFVHVSSMGVYPARDHYGSDETLEPSVSGIDGYTLTKFESEKLVLRYVAEHNLPATVLRPGFIYGPRDRTVLPRIIEKLRDGKFAFIASRDKLLNNTYVGNLCDAVRLAVEHDESVGRVFNIADPRLVSKSEFIAAIAEGADCPMPTKVVPMAIARPLAKTLETVYRLLGKSAAPILSGAKVKFLGLNLDYSIQRARVELGYDPQVDFAAGMRTTMDWFREQNLV